MNRKQIFAAVAALTVSAAGHAATIWADNFDANVLALNGTPIGWSVESGTVDIIGSNVSGSLYDFLPGHGAYIDLDGSTGASGTLSTLLTLTAGVRYSVGFELAGSQRGSHESGTVTFGDSVLNWGIASAVPFMYQSLSFTPTTTGQYSLSFQNAGGDNVGALLDNVSVTAAVPEPETYALLVAGLVAVGFVSRRRRQSVA